MSNVSLLYCTLANKDDAITMAKALLNEKLIACANILDNVTSLYFWETDLQIEQEVILLLKTTSNLQGQVIDKIKQLHNYACPCILVFESQNGNTDFINWVNTQVLNPM